MRNSHLGAALCLTLTAVLGLGGAAVAADQPADYAAALAQAKAADQILILDFFTEW